NAKGSEHTIDGLSFAAELQLFAFNSQLYSNWREAESRPNGVAAVAILVVLLDRELKISKEDKEGNKQLKLLADSLRVSNKGKAIDLNAYQVKRTVRKKEKIMERKC